MKLICCSIFVIAFIQGLLAAPNRNVEEPTKDDTHKTPIKTKADVKSVAENKPVKAISEGDSNESSYGSRDFDKILANYKAADAHLETSDQDKNSAVKTDVSATALGSAESPKLTAPKPVKSAKSTETKRKESFEFESNLDGEAKTVENIYVDGQRGRNLEDLIKENVSGQIPNEAENVDFQWEAHNDGSDSGSFDNNWEWDYSTESSKVDSVNVTTKTDTKDSSKKSSTHHDISHHRHHHEDESHENKPLRQLGSNGKANHTQPNTPSKPQPATPTKETDSHSYENIHGNGHERHHFAHNGYNHGHWSHSQSASDEDGTASKAQTNSESNTTSDVPINTQNPDTTPNARVDSQNPDSGSDAPVASDIPTSNAPVDNQNPDTTSDASVNTQNPYEYSCRLPQVPNLPKKRFGSGPEIICSCSCRPFEDIYSDFAFVVPKAINLSFGFVNRGDPKLDCSCSCVPSRDC